MRRRQGGGDGGIEEKGSLVGKKNSLVRYVYSLAPNFVLSFPILLIYLISDGVRDTKER